MSLSEEYDYDLIVIGGGSGGLSCVKEAHELGAKILLVDYTKPTKKGYSWGLGGTCVNVGCIPKKLMHQAAQLGEAVHDATFYGWKIPNEEDIILNWSNMIEAIQSEIRSTNWVLKVNLRIKKIKYIIGLGSFVDNNTIKVKMENGNESYYKGKFILIATGLRPVYPNIPGAFKYGITSEDLFTLSKHPGDTLVVGAGYISCETVGLLRMLGLSVTMMIRGKILNNLDQDMANIILDSLKERGVKILRHCQPFQVEKLTNGKLLVKYKNIKTKKESLGTFDTVIWATGRKSTIEDLNIQAINLETKDDLIVVNAEERTNVPNIFAVGDVTSGRPPLASVAVMSGQYLARRLFSDSSYLVTYDNVASTLSTPLEYSCVGLTEDLAIRKFGEHKIEVYHSHYNPLEFELPEKVTKFCYIKIIAFREPPQKVLGIHFIGPHAGEVMQGFSVAFNCGLNIETLFNTVGVSPTNAREILRSFISKRSGLDISSFVNMC